MILDRILIIRVAEDRGIIGADSLWLELEAWRNRGLPTPFMRSLKNIFRDFDDVYNSKLFQTHNCENLKIDNEVLEFILSEKTLYSYNFDLIDADVLGAIYEDYIGHILSEENSGIEIVQDKTARKKSGIYYTPTYVVDYIVRTTLGEILKKCKTPKEVSQIKVLDPACGSGSFLIKAFDVIKEWYDNYNLQEEMNNKGKNWSKINQILNIEMKIITENLYGVDLDKQAAEIAAVNLMLKALKKGQRLPIILDKNIKCGNSLVYGEIDFLEQYFSNPEKERPFSWREEFPEIIKRGGFDVIIGNPPYVDVKTLPQELVKYIFKVYPETTSNRINLYSAFIDRGLSLLRKNGRFGYVIPDSLLVGSSYAKLRESLLKKRKIENIVRLPSNVFVGKVDTIILTLKNETTNDNFVNVLIYDKKDVISTINENNSMVKKIISQKIWLNKNKYVFDIYYDLIKDKIAKKIEINSESLIQHYDFSLGISPYDKYKGHSKDQIKNKVFHSKEKLDDRYKKLLSGKDITRYALQWNGNEWIKYGKWLGRPREKRFFTEPRIILRQIISGQPPRIYATYSDEEYYNTQIEFTIIRKNNDNYDPKYILALLNSKLMNFYHTETYVDKSKTLFPKLLIENAKQFPIKRSNIDNEIEIINNVDKIMELKTKQYLIINDFMRYWPPIYDELTLKQYYSELSVTDTNILDIRSRGTIQKVYVKEDSEWLILSTDYYETKKGKKEYYENIPILKCRFKNTFMRKYLFYIILHNKKKLGTGNLSTNILKIPVPRFDKNPQINMEIIQKIIDNYLTAMHQKEELENKIKNIDTAIDAKIYEVYELTEDEISIVENSLA